MEIYDSAFGDLTILSIKCVLCGENHGVQVGKEDFVSFNNGEKLIQDCFPYLTVDERELILSGVCGKCFDKIYEDEE